MLAGFLFSVLAGREVIDTVKSTYKSLWIFIANVITDISYTHLRVSKHVFALLQTDSCKQGGEGIAVEGLNNFRTVGNRKMKVFSQTAKGNCLIILHNIL